MSQEVEPVAANPSMGLDQILNWEFRQARAPQWEVYDGDSAVMRIGHSCYFMGPDGYYMPVEKGHEQRGTRHFNSVQRSVPPKPVAL
jgi:hypothetical protein